MILALLLAAMLELITPSEGFRYPISCYLCASEEYEPLYARSRYMQNFGQPMRFDKFCDDSEAVRKYSPAIRCDSACVTVFEPQFFGGVLNEKKPHTFIRGCATDIFAMATSRPAEVDYMHRGTICLPLMASEIWPEAMSDDMVTVCSCTATGCNLQHTLPSHGPSSKYPLLSLTLMMLCLARSLAFSM